MRYKLSIGGKKVTLSESINKLFDIRAIEKKFSETPFFIDRDCKLFMGAYNLINNIANIYDTDDNIISELKYLKKNKIFHNLNSDIINLDVRGICLVTTYKTLTKSHWFNTNKHKINNSHLYCDYDIEIFTEFLRLLRNPAHKPPQKYMKKIQLLLTGKCEYNYENNKNEYFENISEVNETNSDIYLSGNPQITFYKTKSTR